MNINDCRCVTDGARCMHEVGWTFHSNYTQTVVLNDDDDFLLLSLHIGGFHGDAAASQTDSHKDKQQIAELSFEFETRCTQHCEFALLRVRLSSSLSLCVFHCLLMCVH